MAAITPEQRAAGTGDVHARRGQAAFRRLNGRAFNEAVQRVEDALDTTQVVRTPDRGDRR